MKAEISKLAQEINDGAVTGEIVETQLSTSQRIIARVTDGIYREPWAAFRELIANAYDADASRVTIESGAPDFDQIAVRDNGSGMSSETLAYVLKSIGGSSKRTTIGKELQTTSTVSADVSPGGRPLIGKIGIGLFAVAQLTQHFQIITKSRGSKFRHSATVRLTTHSELGSRDPDADFIAGTVSIRSEPVSIDEFEDHGTSVILYDLRPAVKSTLQSRRRWSMLLSNDSEAAKVQSRPDVHIGLLAGLLESGSPPVAPCYPWQKDASATERFEALVEATKTRHSYKPTPTTLANFDEYFRLIWNLSLSLPLPYMKDHPLEKTNSSGIIFLTSEPDLGKDSIVHLADNQTVRDAFSLPRDPPFDRFDVIFDGIKLSRPIDLTNELRRESRVSAPMLMVGKVVNAFAARDLERAGGQLSFHAYLYWNSQILPRETAGTLIRIRGASGTLFDPKFLNYQVSEQNRLSQITCEIFVDEGLDGAINIDRESFNFSHPHYLYVQNWLHNALRTLISRNKRIAAGNLREQRNAERLTAQHRRIERALKIWGKFRGDDADPPFDLGKVDGWPESIGLADIAWGSSPSSRRGSMIALGIVLEAFDVLSHLEPHQRLQLITEALSALEIEFDD